MTYTLRQLQLPEDYEAIAQLLNTHWSEPTTAKRLEEDDAKLFEVGDTYMDENGLLAGYDRSRRVAVTEQDIIVGYLYAWRASFTERGYLNNTLVVAEAYRGQGIGQLLFQYILDWSASLGATNLLGDTWDDDPAALRFAEHRGFMIERQAYQSVLNLNQYVLDHSLYELLDSIEQEGIRFTTLADELGEDRELKLYEIYKETLVDIPGHTGDVHDIDEWRKWKLMSEGYAPERVIIATDGDKYVGVTNVLYKPLTNGMYHEYTGVSRAYRGRKIALALKVKAILLAQQMNASYIRTDNDSKNKPILSINRQLGYEPLRGSYMLIATR